MESNIIPQLQRFAVPIDSLAPDPANARRHGEKNLAAIEASLRRFGQRTPIVVQAEGRIVRAGNGRLAAAKALGWIEIAAVIVEEANVEAAAFAIADNRTSDLAGWDDVALAEQLSAFEADNVDLEDIGFWKEDYQALLDGITPSTGPEGYGAPDPEALSLFDKFLIPPFSVLDARAGYWQKRKKAWIARGVCGLQGRGDGKTFNPSFLMTSSTDFPNTSVFDPVLAEIMYRWFCPPGGLVIDPFAGGAVRGLVAAALDRRYWGCDVSADQVAANEEQATVSSDRRVSVIVSGKQLRQLFHPCSEEYVRDVCRSRCCESSDGVSIAVHPTERGRIERLGGTVENGYLVADSRGLCPFKTDEGRCRVHENKPLGCKASPFTFSDSGRVVVRNRYRRLRCFKCDGAVPAYEAHAWSLAAIFGPEEAGRIAAAARDGADDIAADMPESSARILADNHALRNGKKVPLQLTCDWICNDAAIALDDAPEADMIFSCPPYFDLERYSDDERDLSNAGRYDEFLEAYRAIIAKAVARLRDDRFAAWVVGDIRDKKGKYRNFVGDSVQAFIDAGMAFYNDAVLVYAVNTLSLRAGAYFSRGRKLGKCHQNVLVFVKGDPQKATEAIPIDPEELRESMAEYDTSEECEET